MMLQAEMRHVIAQAQQEVVVAIVMGAEKLVGLFDQIFVMVPDFLRRIESGGAVGGDVDLGKRVIGKLDNFEKFAGDYGRIDQRGEGRWFEYNLRFAVFASGGRDGQRCSIFPIGGKS